jgi:hypothetical protein
MLWLILSLVLSAAVLGGVWYYTQQDDIKKKKAGSSYQTGQDTTKLPGKQKSFADIWDIEDVRDSVVFLKNGRHSAAIRVGAIDFRMMSEAEQEAVENALIQTALTLSFDVQMYATSEYIDVEAAKQEIESNNVSNNRKLAMLQQEALNFLDGIAKSRGTVRRNYIIVSYEGNPEKVHQELNRYCNIIISSLTRAKVPAYRLGSSEILDLVYSRLNRGSTAKPSAAAAAGAFDLYVAGATYTEPYTEGV